MCRDLEVGEQRATPTCIRDPTVDAPARSVGGGGTSGSTVAPGFKRATIKGGSTPGGSHSEDPTEPCNKSPREERSWGGKELQERCCGRGGAKARAGPEGWPRVGGVSGFWRGSA